MHLTFVCVGFRHWEDLPANHNAQAGCSQPFVHEALWQGRHRTGVGGPASGCTQASAAVGKQLQRCLLPSRTTNGSRGQL